MNLCNSCGSPTSGKFCSNCGQPISLKRISISSLLHDVFHFFTHIDKGILYTLKMLVVAPGEMQKDYMQGNRAKHQKPFSMFFIFGTLSGLLYYYINYFLVKFYNFGNKDELNFFEQYWVIFQIIMLPLYTIINYVCFRKSKYNFGELTVFLLYTFSIIFLLAGTIQFVKFFGDIETRFIELPIFTGYLLITNFNFFSDMPKRSIIVNSILSITLNFAIASLFQDLIVELIYR